MLILVGALAGCASHDLRPYSKTEFAFDTVCTITIYGKAPQGTLQRAFSLLRNVGARMTIDAKQSELIKVNEAAGRHPVQVDAELFHLIQVGLHFSQLTHGAFDITVGPLTELWRIGTGGESVPSPVRIQGALKLIDYRDVVLDEESRTVFLKRPGMAIDLGAISKGYAGDRVKELLEKAGVRRAIIDLGGNVIAMGSKPGNLPWRIGIQNPDQSRGSYVGVISVEDKAVVSSGQYERFFVFKGEHYGHILSTNTGYPVDNGVTSTTIITASSTIADALSTAVFALGIDKGLELVNSLKGVEAIILTAGKKVYVSNGIEGSFRLTDPSYTMASQIAVPSG